MRPRRTSTLPALLLVAAGALGCGVTLPWSSGSPPDAPVGLAVHPGMLDGVVVAWEVQDGIDGYELQSRSGGGPWGPPPGYQLGPSAWYAPFGQVAELETMNFRLRAIAGGYASGWVEATAVRPLRPPGLTIDGSTTPWIPLTGPVVLRWTNASLVATDVLVERGPGSGMGPWTVLAGATLAAGSLVDHDLQDGASYQYRVRVGTGGVWSDAAFALAGPIVLAAPWGLAATKVASGVALTWHAQSTTATGTTVHRSDGASTPLSGVPAAWLDPTPVIWPSTSYQVSVNATYVWAYSEWAFLPPFAVAGPPALTAGAVELPAATHVARAADGRFLLLDVLPWSGTAYRPTASGWDAHAVSGPAYTSVNFLSPGIAADGTGAPHLVYEWTNPSTSSRDLVHDAWNGTAWEAEVLQSNTALSGGGASPAFAVAPGGAVHVVYFGQAASSRPVLHLVREAGVTTTTLVDPEPTTSFYPLALALGAGADGTVVLAREGYAYTAGGTPLELSTRTPAGAWSLDPVPIGSTPVNGFSLAVGSGGDVAVAYARTSWGPSVAEEIRVIRRVGGVWSAPELAFARPWGGGGDVAALAATPDLSRIALLASSGNASWIAARGSAGWDAVQVGPSLRPGWHGFGASGLWALYRGETSAQPTVRYSLFAGAP